MSTPLQMTPGTSTVDANALHRGLTLRHILFIALGSAIGTGLFYGSASAIELAGPSVLLAYLIGGAAVFMVMRAMGEMALAHPVAGSFSEYATIYLGRGAGFITGWTFAIEMALVAIADVTAFAVYMKFWFPGTPSWIWITSVLLIILAINFAKVKAFGETEFWLTVIKVTAIIAMIVGGIILLIFGARLNADVSPAVSNLWSHGGFFPNGLGGFLACFTVVMFAFGGVETVGIAAGEADNPKVSIPKAINTLPVRILLFYVLTLTVIMSLYPWNEITGETSPFVQIFEGLGIGAAAHILNLVVVTAAISAINADVYAAGRMLFGLAQRGMAPASFNKVSKNGTPFMTVVSMGVVLVVGVLVNVFFEQAFLVVAAVATYATVMVWVMILLTHIAFKKQKAREGVTTDFPVPGWPIASYLALAFLTFVVVMFAFFPETQIALIAGVISSVLLGLYYKFFIQKKVTQ
ncbi:amino acid permease [Rothia terrae]|uniref:Amino acid permease n=1 Tax=Rothia terrae TaxID=396015 RepID=A0A7H2BC42_9MICC|nr:amino acid permease [Rothia terrae]QNV37238.1 amino acid permease [Rothia terrae]